jgi:hypothetical protein
MCDAWLARLEQSVDLSQKLLISVLDAGVLLLVLLPAADDEHLCEQVLVVEVAVKVPVNRPGPTSHAPHWASQRRRKSG